MARLNARAPLLIALAAILLALLAATTTGVNADACELKRGIRENQCKAKANGGCAVAWHGYGCQTACGKRIKNKLEALTAKARAGGWFGTKRYKVAKIAINRSCRPKTYKDGGCQAQGWCGYHCEELCKPQFGCAWTGSKCVSSNSTNSTSG